MKGGSTEPPSTQTTTPIASIRQRLASIVDRELEKMERGEIDQLSAQHNEMLHQLLQFSNRQNRHPVTQQNNRKQGNRQRGSQHGGRQRKPRPHCTYDKCEKPVGHWESTCLQKARDLRGRRDAPKRDRSASGRTRTCA